MNRLDTVRYTDRRARCIAVLGTGSDVGKSVLVAGLCRYFADLGVRVAPFKAQNMSNNSGVTPEGLEMGRAQIVQAEAARIAPHVDMNPVLLKPTSEIGAQVVVLGEAIANSSAKTYHGMKEGLFQIASQALERLRSRYDLVILEGAGSCAEVNLMATDIVNFRMAAYADAPVLLVGDIHRGGIFAQLIGTLACIGPAERERVAGFIINRFRGDAGLFSDGVQWIEAQTGKNVYGVVPWFSHFDIEAEDSVVIEKPKAAAPPSSADHRIGVIRLPHISNFTDFDPLKRISGIDLQYIEQPMALHGFRAVILPGSKNTRADMAWLQTTGWAGRLIEYGTSGGHLLGICGGYQMLGTVVRDPDGLEGRPGESAALGLLPVQTVLQAPKVTTRTEFRWGDAKGLGYEIHMGQTMLKSGAEHLVSIRSRNAVICDDVDGCTAFEGRVMGTYLHGFFDMPEVTARWLSTLGLGALAAQAAHGPAGRDRAYDLLSEHLQAHLDLAAIRRLVEGVCPSCS
jgi:adenosylcobyric acid synthase